MECYAISTVNREQLKPYLLEIHYAKRFPSVSFSFGLFRDGLLCGVVCYGTPASSALRKGLAGEGLAPSVLELNRLCLKDNLPNEASFLVARSLKLLPKNKIIISFADCSQGHQGTVYQACNFTYHGLSAKRTDWALHSKPHLHGQTVADEFRGIPNRAAKMREKYGEDFYLKPRPRKHRYVYVTGSKGFKKLVKNSIKYKQQGFPKESINDY